MGESNSVRVGVKTPTPQPKTVIDIERVRQKISVDVGDSLNQAINAFDDALRRLKEINSVCAISDDLNAASRRAKIDMTKIQHDLNELRSLVNEVLENKE